jgi:hypothetical protein
MFPHLVEAKYVENHSVWLRFDDGAFGEVDLSDALDGPIFVALRDLDCFEQFRIEGHTLAWPNGADFAPEFLHARLSTRIADRPNGFPAAAFSSGDNPTEYRSPPNAPLCVSSEI